MCSPAPCSVIGCRLNAPYRPYSPMPAPHLPIVDFLDADAPRAFVASLHQTGFAVLKNHPRDQALVDGIYAEWLGFFHSDAKNSYPFKPDTHDGYFSTAVSETAKNHSKKDVKEFFHIYPWGQYPAQVSDAALRYYTRGKQLASTLLRVLHYPPLTGQEEPGAMRAAPHGDINLLTILPAATEPGLQVLGTDGGWHDVPCDFGLLIVNIGDMLEEASGRYFPSTVHRVLNPVGEAARKSRVSLPLFLHPRKEVVLSERYTVGSYFEERIRELRING